MKHNCLLATIILIVFGSCKKDCLMEFQAQFYQPVYRSWEDIKADIGSEAPRDIRQPGKIFALGNYLFINEVDEGIHVIDNSDPENPQNIKFINVPGSLDIAAIGNKLVSDNYSDIIMLDISDLNNVYETGRVEDVFYGNSRGLWYDYTQEGVVVAWELLDTIYEYDCEDDIMYFEDAFNGVPVAVAETAGAGGGDAAGKAGSMARFAIYNTMLYALNQHQLNIFDYTDGLALENVFELQWGIETIFPYQNYLFVGANNGMHILDITDPLNPLHLSTYAHVTSCDPVVVQDDIAYVTLRSGTECQGFTDQLDIINVSDKTAPYLLKTYEMYNPHGLGVTYSDLLFICDGDQGLKVFDNIDYMDIHLIQHYEGIHAFDVIPYAGNLLMIGQDGFYQYDYSDIQDIHLISYIPVNP